MITEDLTLKLAQQALGYQLIFRLPTRGATYMKKGEPSRAGLGLYILNTEQYINASTRHMNSRNMVRVTG